MTATLTQVVKQFQQDWTGQLEPEAILTACRDVAYRWRERTLDPVTTIQLFFVQILHGNTACTHLRHLTKCPVTASAYCQARMKLPLTVFEQLLRSVSHALQHKPLDEGRWVGHRTFWVDGSSVSMPDTPALQEHFGQPGKQLPGCGFPVAHLLQSKSDLDALPWYRGCGLWYILFCFLVLYFPVVIQAQEVKVFIMGSGQNSCGKWIESKDIPQYRYQIKQWVLGFISGTNWARDETQVKPPDEQAIVAFIDQYCKNHPLKPVLYGAMALVQQLQPNVSTQYKGD